MLYDCWPNTCSVAGDLHIAFSVYVALQCVKRNMPKKVTLPRSYWGISSVQPLCRQPQASLLSPPSCPKLAVLVGQVA